MKMSRRAFSRCPCPGGIPKLHLPSPQGNSGKIKKYFLRKGAVLVTDRNFYFRPGDTLPAMSWIFVLYYSDIQFVIGI